MFYILKTLCLVFIVFVGLALDAVEEEEFLRKFQSPPNEYKLIQYNFAANRAKVFKEYGIGGTLIFPYKYLYRKDLNYGGIDGFVRAINAANSEGLKVWLADDWGYPSGMAGGMVVKERPDLELKALVMFYQKGKGDTQIKFKLPDDNDLLDIEYAAIYPLKSNGKININAGKKLTFNNKYFNARGIKGKWQLCVFAKVLRNKWLQSTTTAKQFKHTGRYPDVMNETVVDIFIKYMLENAIKPIKYPEKKVIGFYSNEPNLMFGYWKGWKNQAPEQAPYAYLPWTDKLPDRFEKINGYSIYKVLPYMFNEDHIAAKRARIHFWQAVAEQYTKSFAGKIHKWCNKRGLKYNGHFLLNEYLSQHVNGYGDLMKFVAEFDAASLDIGLPEPERFNDFAYQRTRFFSSVASWKNFDTVQILLDPIIGGYGMKRLTPSIPVLINSVNMAAFNGASLFSSYLSLKPRKGDPRFKGYKAANYNFLSEYAGRLSLILRGAERASNVALYYPISMFQANFKATKDFWTKDIKRHQRRQHAWSKTEQVLINSDIEYMIVHPEGVKNAHIKDGKLFVGRGAYSYLIMPQMTIIPLKVLKKIAAFEKAGGKVLWLDKSPKYTEFEKNQKYAVRKFNQYKPVKIHKIPYKICSPYYPEFDLSFSPDTSKLLVGRFLQRRFKSKGEQVYLLINRTLSKMEVSLDGGRNDTSSPLEVLDPSNGKIKNITLPAKLLIPGNRVLIIMPGKMYLAKKVVKYPKIKLNINYAQGARISASSTDRR